MKEPSKHSTEELVETLRFAEYTSKEINQFFSSSQKDKTKATSSTPQPNVFTFASQTEDSDPIVEPSTVKDDNLIEKLREDIRIAEVLESHIKKENSILKDRVHTLQDKYDSLKRKYKTIKRQLKQKDGECVELQKQLETAKATSSSSPTKLQVFATTVVSAAGL